MQNIEWYWWPTWLLVIYLVFSAHTLKPDTVAAVFFLWKPWRVFGPGGFIIAPFGIFQVKKVDISIQRTWTPATKERIVRHDNESLGPGQVRAVRIRHAIKEGAIFYRHPKDPSQILEKPIPYLSLDADDRKMLENDTLQSSIATEVISYADWSVSVKGEHGANSPVFHFIRNVESVENAHKRIDYTMRSALQDLMGPITYRHSLEIKGHIEKLIHSRLEELVGETEPLASAEVSEAEKSWGIDISATQISEIDPGRTVNTATAEEAASISVRRKDMEDAEAEKRTIMLTADGNAYAERTLGEAKAASFEKQAQVLQTEGGKLAAQLEVAKEVLPKAGTIVVPGDMAGVIASVTAIAKSVNK